MARAAARALSNAGRWDCAVFLAGGAGRPPGAPLDSDACSKCGVPVIRQVNEHVVGKNSMAMLVIVINVAIVATPLVIAVL
jgi:hypothetical protein